MKKINNHGFTVVELLVVLAIMMTLMGIVGSQMASWLPNQRLSTSARDLQSAIQLARLECVRLRTDVCIDFDTDNNECFLCVEANVDGFCSQAQGDQLIKTVKLASGVDFFNAAIGVNGNQYFRFNARGIPSENGQLHLRNEYGKFRGVNVGLTGNAKMIQSADGVDWY